jgi:uncharacterized protein YndB with AHSA1/START domain
MEQPKVIHSTFTLERSFNKSPEAVFAALSDPAKLRRWFAGENQNDIQEFTVDFRVGGEEHLRYLLKGGPVAGQQIVNLGRFQEILPNERIVTARTMALEGKCFSAAQVTYEMLRTESGTDLILTHQGAFFDMPNGPQMLEEGWRALMDKLAAELAD